ncbi:glutathione peroxidase [Flavobacterium hydatis]|uniref:Glutathione peroxidase n=1 Tax=Flavobacterium hydatis TaxID=991 RepID=A0A086AAE1_FLAHY|nr:glutathione peroxidase [Flavobacterium hydatis]KFF13655.1 glutathione peroxidase [Flavobacterium hydatis]OXA90309.1 glutathione peroxidase [Flavobacterium hydatis]
MKNILFLFCGVMFLFSCQNQAQTKKNKNSKSENVMEKQTIYQFKVEDLTGNQFDFASLKGKKIMIVNTASKCGLTPQYKDLEAIYKEYKDKGFVIVGFPANNFASQEPGTNEEIGAFCQQNYGVTFPMMDKISVKGDDMNEVYKFLTQKSKNGVQDSEVEWNFQKYLINEKGELVKVIHPKTLPTDPEIINWIKS